MSLDNNRNIARMLKGGVIIDVTTPDEAMIAEEAGAAAVVVTEKISFDEPSNKVVRMIDPSMIRKVRDAVKLPVMAKCRIGHFAEAQILQAVGVDYIDESEDLSPADQRYHIDKTRFDVPFVCGAEDLGGALRRISEGASIIRTKGGHGTGDVRFAVEHMRMIQTEIRRIASMSEEELFEAAVQLKVPYEMLKIVFDQEELPVVLFASGGMVTPADAALMMQLGAEGVFVCSKVFTHKDPLKRAKAIVEAVTNFTDAKVLARLSEEE